MSKTFSKKWEERPQGLKEALKPSKALKPQINNALNRVELQLSRTSSYIEHYTARDKEIFEKLVRAYERHDNARVNMLANELAEIRRQKDILIHSKLGLDNVALRLRTVFEFGNFASALSTVVGILQNIRAGICGIMPEVGNELYNVETSLNDIVVEMGQSTGVAIDFDAKSEDADKILKEAALIAENRMKMKLPELSSDVSPGGQLVIKKDSEAK
ncbi:MAG: Snf7 family protein [Nitrososphaerota archaeon]